MEKTFSKSTVTVCTSCMGKGQQYTETSPARHGSDYGTGVWTLCPTCQGERLIKITEVTTITTEPYIPNLH